MMIRTVMGCTIIAVLGALLTTSCAPDKPAGQQSQLAGSKSSGSNYGSDMPIPPKDAQYTIYCQIVKGPGHVERARQLRDALRHSTSMPDWYLIHGEDQSTVYYGFYRTTDSRDPKDGKEGARAIHDLNTIRAMVDSNGFRPFSASLPVPIDSPDPDANPAWDLARTKGFWSVEIAIYKDNSERKQAAVDSVRAARAQGIEAYYYHGPTTSSVCVGCWPLEAVREIDPGLQNDDPDTPLIVTQTPMNDQLAQSFQQQGLKPVAPRVEVVDPTVTDTLARYPEHGVNGYVHSRSVQDPATGQTKLVPEHSMLVKIQHHETPEAEPSMVEGGAPAAGMREQQSAPQQPAGFGQLKSVGD
jgi:hypothetical protein